MPDYVGILHGPITWLFFLRDNAVIHLQYTIMKTQKYPSFCTFTTLQINNLIDDGRFGTSQTYAKALSSFVRFLQTPDESRRDILFTEIDSLLIYRYNRFLKRRGIIPNSVSFYNRVLRAIYNRAVKQYRFPDKHPFDDVYTGVDKTISRAISANAIARLLTLDYRYDKSLEFSRDIFIFSYATRGMAFVDIAFLKKSNIHGDRISYSRKKSGRHLEVRIEGLARQIIDKYKDADSEYILPILSAGMDDAKAYHTYQSKLTTYNKKLKELAKSLKGPTYLSSYVSRHSWATTARNSNIPMGIISESLGHSSEKMTRIYLGSFDSRLIDDANRKLMGQIKKFVSLQETNPTQIYIYNSKKQEFFFNALSVSRATGR